MEAIRSKLNGDTGRLAGTYLAIIMGLTLVFSVIIFGISSSQFDRPLPRGPMGEFRSIQNDDLQSLFERRADEARGELMLSLVFLNIAVLIGGGMFSYFLARKSLEPIEEAMMAQARFVSDASHELRTPLASLQVTNEVALRKKKLTLADAKELIGYNLVETIKLRDLSEALLGLARQNDSDVTKHDVNVAELVRDAVQTLQPLADEKKITITHDIPAFTAQVNQPAVAQILRILLDNAVKYSLEKSNVIITAEPIGTGANVSVIDTGIGIGEQHRPRVFDRFYRVDESRSSKNVSGHGLGLSIAAAIANRHGYELTLAASSAKGSTFLLRLP